MSKAADDNAPPPFVSHPLHPRFLPASSRLSLCSAPLQLTKTFEMVDDPSTNNVVGWSGDDSFIVRDPGEFSINILPCYFKHNNLSSFVRQLNIYGFRCLSAPSRRSVAPPDSACLARLSQEGE